MYKLIAFILVIIFVCSNTKTDAQNTLDTVAIPFKDAEKIFLQNNLSLLANKYNVDINKALIKQAKL